MEAGRGMATVSPLDQAASWKKLADAAFLTKKTVLRDASPGVAKLDWQSKHS